MRRQLELKDVASWCGLVNTRRLHFEFRFLVLPSLPVYTWDHTDDTVGSTWTNERRSTGGWDVGSSSVGDFSKLHYTMAKRSHLYIHQVPNDTESVSLDTPCFGATTIAGLPLWAKQPRATAHYHHSTPPRKISACQSTSSTHFLSAMHTFAWRARTIFFLQRTASSRVPLQLSMSCTAF